MAVTTVSEVVQGVIQRIDRRTTSTNKPMLTLQVNNAKVSFFADADINQTVAEGQTVQFELYKLCNIVYEKKANKDYTFLIFKKRNYT